MASGFRLKTYRFRDTGRRRSLFDNGTFPTTTLGGDQDEPIRAGQAAVNLHLPYSDSASFFNR
jgi:hypothetical protein